MVDNLYILGAGASADSGAPIMTNFLDVAEDFLASERFRNSKEIHQLFNKIRSLNSLHAKSNVDLNNIESVLGLLEMSELLEYPIDGQNQFLSLKDSYVKMISETIENSMKFNIKGPKWIIPRGSYQDFADLFEDQNRQKNSAIISFNYDVGIDVALHNANVRYTYHLNDSHNLFPLLKLHGSLNWFKNDNKAIETIHLSQFFQTQQYRTYGDKDREGTLTFSGYMKQMRGGFDEYDLPPFIIPPTWNKTMYHASISNVWKKASQCLSQAKNIYVIGYSLPETDAFFKYLFSLGTNSTTRIRKFWVINPDTSGTEKRFRELLGPQMIERFRYLNHDFQTAVNNINNWA